MEIVDQYYQGEWKEKAGFQYLLYLNKEDEKMVGQSSQLRWAFSSFWLQQISFN